MEREVIEEVIQNLREVGENPEYSDLTRIEALKIMYQVIDMRDGRGTENDTS